MGRSCGMAFSDLDDHRIVQDFTVGQCHVRGDMNTLALCELNQFTVLQVRVKFDLIGGDVFGANSGNRFFHQRDGEVRDANLFGQPQLFGFKQCAHKFCYRDCTFR